MNNNETLMIEATQNGYIVQSRIPDSQVRQPDSVMVFETNKALLEFIDKHFDHLREAKENGSNTG